MCRARVGRRKTQRLAQRQNRTLSRLSGLQSKHLTGGPCDLSKEYCYRPFGRIHIYLPVHRQAHQQSLQASEQRRMETRRKLPFPSFFATPQRNQIPDTPQPVTPSSSSSHASAKRLETATTATALSAGRVGGSGGDVLDATDLHASTGKSAKGGLSAGPRGLGAVACARTVSLQYWGAL